MIRLSDRVRARALARVFDSRLKIQRLKYIFESQRPDGFRGLGNASARGTSGEKSSRARLIRRRQSRAASSSSACVRLHTRPSIFHLPSRARANRIGRVCAAVEWRNHSYGVRHSISNFASIPPLPPFSGPFPPPPPLRRSRTPFSPPRPPSLRQVCPLRSQSTPVPRVSVRLHPVPLHPFASVVPYANPGADSRFSKAYSACSRHLLFRRCTAGARGSKMQKRIYGAFQKLCAFLRVEESSVVFLARRKIPAAKR